MIKLFKKCPVTCYPKVELKLCPDKYLEYRGTILYEGKFYHAQINCILHEIHVMHEYDEIRSLSPLTPLYKHQALHEIRECIFKISLDKNRLKVYK